MKEILLAIIKKPFSLGRLKVLLFVPLVTGLFFDFKFRVDGENDNISLSSGGSEHLSLIVFLLIFFIVIVLLDVLHANKNRKERQSILDIIRHPDTPDSVKKILADKYNKLG